ncbi:MAG: hypothetical protein IPK44_01630 [Candidatus Accumulibacter sp.]|uniref:hypothetical protein n=1 Tax=Accumulibacter sp. TaxID=2053492 RepID=UPI002589B876|nr:hypothetical protein [Accumulibacter sp.]MBK8113301.1 hypothetical protein [Accumulibacter sp.]
MKRHFRIFTVDNLVKQYYVSEMFTKDRAQAEVFFGDDKYAADLSDVGWQIEWCGEDEELNLMNAQRLPGLQTPNQGKRYESIIEHVFYLVQGRYPDRYDEDRSEDDADEIVAMLDYFVFESNLDVMALALAWKTRSPSPRDTAHVRGL